MNEYLQYEVKKTLHEWILQYEEEENLEAPTQDLYRLYRMQKKYNSVYACMQGRTPLKAIT